MKAAAEHLDSAAQQAAAGAWSHSHFLGYLLEGELNERHSKAVELNIQLSHLPYMKKLEDFDFSAQPGLDRRLIEELATGRFLFLKEAMWFFSALPALERRIWQFRWH